MIQVVNLGCQDSEGGGGGTRGSSREMYHGEGEKKQILDTCVTKIT